MFLVVAVTVAFAAEGKDAAIQPIVNLRDSGYLLGDLVDEHVELALPAGFRLDADSLPLPGRVAPWLEVRSARIDDGQQAIGSPSPSPIRCSPKSNRLRACRFRGSLCACAAQRRCKP